MIISRRTHCERIISNIDKNNEPSNPDSLLQKPTEVTDKNFHPFELLHKQKEVFLSSFVSLEGLRDQPQLCYHKWGNGTGTDVKASDVPRLVSVRNKPIYIASLFAIITFF